MINIENVSMKFNLGIEKDFSIKQAFVNLFTKKGKRKKEELTKEEIMYAVNGYVEGSIKDYQISALLMAICLNDMTEEEERLLGL